MALGFVLVKVDPGREQATLRELQRTPGLAEAFPLFGEYDFIIKMEARDFDELGRRIIKGIRSVKGVRSTETLTVTRF